MSLRDIASQKVVDALDSEFLRALAEPARLQIVRVLFLQGPSDVGAISQHLSQDRSVVSRHLKVLDQAGVVGGEKRGRHHVYSLKAAEVMNRLSKVLSSIQEACAVCCPI